MYRLKIFAAALLIGATASAAAAKDPSEIFAAHDPHGRLPNTSIERLGEIKVDRATFAIFYLTFVNPDSQHGQQRNAIIRNDNQFEGSFQCWLREGGAKLAIGKDRLTVREGDMQFVVRFDRNGPTRKAKALCGEGSGWENSI